VIDNIGAGSQKGIISPVCECDRFEFSRGSRSAFVSAGFAGAFWGHFEGCLIPGQTHAGQNALGINRIRAGYGVSVAGCFYFV